MTIKGKARNTRNDLVNINPINRTAIDINTAYDTVSFTYCSGLLVTLDLNRLIFKSGNLAAILL
jgi:hypothetical protein